MWRVQPLLYNDREMGGYTIAVSGQWFGIHVPTVGDRRATTEILLEAGCFCVVRTEMLRERNKVRA
jgi:hypothetical protein